ncbi:hypothetical protein [Streptomyces sp. NPDC058086]|uniref:hypothetical protein n=1 Tax=Streptomyces sp. NPDC058086 TaxID=3346334 RepID=UPI0036E528B3
MQDLQRVRTRVLRTILRLGGHRADVHALAEAAARHSDAVDPVQGAARAVAEGAGVRAETDDQPFRFGRAAGPTAGRPSKVAITAVTVSSAAAVLLRRTEVSVVSVRV